MPDPTQNSTDPQPDYAPTSSTPDQESEQEATVNATPDMAPIEPDTTTPSSQSSSTQQNMGDGAGIRGDYGNASQTNGLEGGPDKTDSPDQPDQPLTDTELTGS